MKGNYLIASRLVVLLAVALVLVQCGRNSRATHETGVRILSLTSLDQLRQVFNGDQGRIRLVALLSPV